MNNCPVEYTLSIIKNKWVVLILREIFYNNVNGFNYLLKNINGISKKVLSSNLNMLIQKNIIIKEVENKNNTIKTNYYLTNKGKDLFPILESMKNYGISYNKLKK